MIKKPTNLVVRCFMLGLFLSSLAVPGGGAPASDARQQAPQSGEIVLTLPAAPLAISWSPSGKDCIYVLGEELRDWPRGRRLHLGRPDAAGGYWTSTARWRQDGTEVAVVLATTVHVINFEQFAIKRRLRNTFPVWWSGRTLCYAQAKQDWTPAGHQAWYCGNTRHRTPRGTYLSDVSEDGKVALTYLARSHEPQEALMALDSRRGRFRLLRAFPPTRGDGSDYHDPERVVMKWNPGVRAAAVLYAFTWTDTGSLVAYYADGRREYRVGQAISDYLAFADEPPDWAGDRVLAKVRLFTEYDRQGQHIAEDWYRLVLWDPKRAEVRALLNYGGERSEDPKQISPHDPLGVFALSPDGKRLAYSRFEQKETAYKLIITDLAALVPQ